MRRSNFTIQLWFTYLTAMAYTGQQVRLSLPAGWLKATHWTQHEGTEVQDIQLHLEVPDVCIETVVSKQL